MSKIHELKILPQYFSDVVSGKKIFELRKNDREFEVGDTLVLKEYLQEISDRYKTTLHAQYTGQEVKKEISYILDGGKYGLQEGYVILALGEYKVKSKPPFRVICIDDDCCGELVEGRRYIVTKEIDDRYVLLGLSEGEYPTCYFERI